MVHTLKEVVNKMLVRANTNIEDLVEIIGLYTLNMIIENR